jgi:hypothetical protein
MALTSGNEFAYTMIGGRTGGGPPGLGGRVRWAPVIGERGGALASG